MTRGLKWLASLSMLSLATAGLAGCKKDAPPPAPLPRPQPATDDTPPPAPPSPDITLSASPSSVDKGGQVTLRWNSQNADSVVIDNNIGNVALNGSVVVTPNQSTTYTATARNVSGEDRAVARVSVVEPKPAPIATDQERLNEAIARGEVQPIFFAYDKAVLTQQAKDTLEANAKVLREYPNSSFIIEGHCDERGSEEYNLALGDRRAQAAADYLTQLGIPASRFETISYGEEKPFAQGHNEQAWQQNRRAHFNTERR